MPCYCNDALKNTQLLKHFPKYFPARVQSIKEKQVNITAVCLG